MLNNYNLLSIDLTGMDEKPSSQQATAPQIPRNIFILFLFSIYIDAIS
jgi:hypothetical protein